MTASIGSRSTIARGTPPNCSATPTPRCTGPRQGADCVEAYAPGAHESTGSLCAPPPSCAGAQRRDRALFPADRELTTGHVSGRGARRWLHPTGAARRRTSSCRSPRRRAGRRRSGSGSSAPAGAFARWRATDLPFANASLSVNVGTPAGRRPGFDGLVAELLAETGIPAELLWLEITETALLADVKASTVALRNCAASACTSPSTTSAPASSLTYLKRFPVEAIRIDRGFVGGTRPRRDDTTIVEAVVNLGHSFGIDVIAEGLETPLQLAGLPRARLRPRPGVSLRPSPAGRDRRGRAHRA